MLAEARFRRMGRRSGTGTHTHTHTHTHLEVTVFARGSDGCVVTVPTKYTKIDDKQSGSNLFVNTHCNPLFLNAKNENHISKKTKVQG